MAVRLFILCALSCLGLFLCPASSQAQALFDGKHERGAWYIGFGVGSGNGSVGARSTKLEASDLGKPTSSPSITSLSLRGGLTLGDGFLLGVERSSFTSSVDRPYFRARLQLRSTNVVGTWFPFDEGIFLRGGVGLSSVFIEIDSFTAFVLDDGFGVGFQAGAGYALWVGDSFNTSLSVDYHTHSYSGEARGPDAGDFVNIAVGFDWF